MDPDQEPILDQDPNRIRNYGCNIRSGVNLCVSAGLEVHLNMTVVLDVAVQLLAAHRTAQNHCRQGLASLRAASIW